MSHFVASAVLCVCVGGVEMEVFVGAGNREVASCGGGSLVRNARFGGLTVNFGRITKRSFCRLMGLF